MNYDFDKFVERRGSCCVKYDALEAVYGNADLIPLWVADMDFETPDFIMDALRKRLEHPVLGYASEHPDYWPAVLDWQKKRNGWERLQEKLTNLVMLQEQNTTNLED